MSGRTRPVAGLGWVGPVSTAGINSLSGADAAGGVTSSPFAAGVARSCRRSPGVRDRLFRSTENGLRCRRIPDLPIGVTAPN
jgi:hypothetical protein